MSAPGSRLARQMRPHLGTELCDEFVEHVNQHYKAGWLRASAPASGVLRCVLDTLDSAPCTHAALVDLRAGTGTGVWGGSARSVRPSSCCTWTTRGRCMRRVTGGARQCARRRGRGTTDRTVRHCATACLACMGVSEAHGAACVRFRCGPPRDAEGVVLQCCGPRVLLSVVAVVLGGFLHRECVHLCVLLWVSFECCFLRDRTPAELPLTLYRPQFYSEPSHSSTCQTNSSHSFRKAHWVGPT